MESIDEFLKWLNQRALDDEERPSTTGAPSQRFAPDGILCLGRFYPASAKHDSPAA
jgi:hypothetical protein